MVHFGLNYKGNFTNYKHKYILFTETTFYQTPLLVGIPPLRLKVRQKFLRSKVFGQTVVERFWGTLKLNFKHFLLTQSVGTSMGHPFQIEFPPLHSDLIIGRTPH